MKKVTGFLRQDTGVGYYRIGQPILFLDRVMKTKSAITPFTGTNKITTIGWMDKAPAWNDKMLYEISDGADILWSNMIYTDEETLKMMNIRELTGARWVIDMDDDMYSVTQANPMADKVKMLLPNIERSLRLADGMTVSVPRLKEVFGHLNENIYINPNGIDFSWLKPNKKPHRKLRIGWRGAEGHRTDLLLIEPALKAIQKDYDVELVSLGAKPPFETRYEGWVNFLDFPEKLAELDLDIAVVPLVDNAYNQSKSNLAILEYSAMKVPVVASPTENQKNMPILYANSNYEWYSKIEELIKNRKLRQNQAENQYKFAKKHFDMKKLSPGLYDFFENLPRKDHKPI